VASIRDGFSLTFKNVVSSTATSNFSDGADGDTAITLAPGQAPAIDPSNHSYGIAKCSTLTDI
jgi:hypothetical protein